MRFVLLGGAEAGRPLAMALADHPEHAIPVAIRPGPLADDLLSRARGIRLEDDPDEALVAGEIDAAIVLGWDEGVLVAAKRLASTGVPLVLVPDARQDTAYVYELTLVRDDVGVPLIPAIPVVVHPRLRWLRSVLRGETDAGLGTVQWLRWEREEPVGRDGFTPAEFDVALLRDTAILRHVNGDFDRVTALHTTAGAGAGAAADAGITGATVTLGGGDRPEVTWQLRGGSTSRWRLEVVGSDGRFEVSGTSDPRVVEVLGTGVDPGVPPDDDVGPRLRDTLVRQLGGTIDPTDPTWEQLVRDFEVVDAARRSVRRRRTIDLLFETTSERSQFKSQMAAGGCGVLLYSLFALVAAAALNTLGNLPKGWRPWAMILLFLPVFAFLVLQVLIVVARPSRSVEDRDG